MSTRAVVERFTGETAIFYLHCPKEDHGETLCALEHEQRYFEETVEYWRRWLSQCTYAGACHVPSKVSNLHDTARKMERAGGTQRVDTEADVLRTDRSDHCGGHVRTPRRGDVGVSRTSEAPL